MLHIFKFRFSGLWESKLRFSVTLRCNLAARSQHFGSTSNQQLWLPLDNWAADYSV